MMTKSNSSGAVQNHLFKPLLLDIVPTRHAMVKLADAIDWQSFEEGLQSCFCSYNWRSPYFCQIFKFAFIQLACQLGKCYTKRFGKGRAREGKNLSSKGSSFSHLAFA
ncbi:MAG: hypothetical protein PHI35_00935 [Victivallaceae bacterium]|nr:hypothetical protein [Victivallaceae bacterium]